MAERQARVAALNMMGHCQSYIAVPFFWTERLSSIGRKFSNDFSRVRAHARTAARGQGRQGQRTGEGRKRAMADGVKFGRKRKLSEYQRAEAIRRRDAGETLAAIAKSYGVDLSMISRL
jgi:DNA invertase Pin-like site-specific DNA recombinase